MLREIIVGSREDAKTFTNDRPYAVITFSGISLNRTPPKLTKSPNLVARLVVRADDTYPNNGTFLALSPDDGKRIARFVRHVAPKIEVLFIHCIAGKGRSCGAAIAIARAFNLSWKNFCDPKLDRFPNAWITYLVAKALQMAGYECDPAAAASYTREWLDYMGVSLAWLVPTLEELERQGLRGDAFRRALDARVAEENQRRWQAEGL